MYQAYRASIGRYAIAHGALGGDGFSYARTSWIKPNFLWMMDRSGWGTKEGQETTLALRLSRRFFERILSEAVGSSFGQSGYATPEDWKTAMAGSEVRLQWDPDHGPDGRPLARRAIQLGLKGRLLEAFGKRELVEVIDLTSFVAEQRRVLISAEPGRLQTPVEQVYRPADSVVAARLGLD